MDFHNSSCIRECQSHRRKNFLPYIRYVATIPCESLRHKSNTFHTNISTLPILYRSHLQKPVSIKKQNTAESQRLKIYFLNVHHSREHMHLNDYIYIRHCAIAAAMTVWSMQQPPLPQRTFFQLLLSWIGERYDPL